MQTILIVYITWKVIFTQNVLIKIVSKQTRMTTYFKDVTQENEGNDLSRLFDMNLNRIYIVDETTYIICSSCDVKSEADLNLLEIIMSPL